MAALIVGTGATMSTANGWADAPMPDRPSRPLPLALWLFAIAAAMRLCFVLATSDSAGPFSSFYKGDTAIWLQYANALRQGQPFALELGLPLRPPATAWLISVLWDGTPDGLRSLRIVYALLGALLAPLTFAAALRLGTRVAACAGGLVAIATGPMMLAATPGSEVPYALLAVLAIGLSVRVVRAPRTIELVAIGFLNAAACLFRAEHLLAFTATLVWIAWSWRKVPTVRPGRAWLRVGVVALAAAATLAPWQLSAAAAVDRYNEVENPPLMRSSMPWDADAVAELAREPGFCRAATQRFVEATVRHRGGHAVGAAELAVLDEAFGFRPRRLPTWFFVAIYGPLNFFLANAADADGGFSRAAIERRPPLAGGTERYPPDWLASLPSGAALSLDYPPHLQAVLDGGSLARSWIAAHPLDFAALAARKLTIAWSGVAHGLGGYAVPVGASGLRRRVDVTVPEGWFAGAWRIALLVLTAFGVARSRQAAAAMPWLIWLGAAIVVTVAFFGYARQGAMVMPAVAVCLGLALEPLMVRRPRVAMVAGTAVLIVVVGLEVVRTVAPPTLFVDGQAVGQVEPWPPMQYQDRHVEAR